MGSTAVQVFFKDDREIFLSGKLMEGHVLIDFSKPQKARSKSIYSNHPWASAEFFLGGYRQAQNFQDIDRPVRSPIFGGGIFVFPTFF